MTQMVPISLIIVIIFTWIFFIFREITVPKFKVGDILVSSEKEEWERKDFYYIKAVGKHKYKLIDLCGCYENTLNDFDYVHRNMELYTGSKDFINWDDLK